MSFAIDPEGAETAVIHDLVDFSGKDVLEVGCGDGRVTWRYANEAATVVALDLDQEKIGRAVGSTPKDLRSRVRFLRADITDVRLPRGGFDVVVLSHSL